MGAWAQKRAIERTQWEPLIRSGMTVAQMAVQRGVSRQRISQKLEALDLSDLYKRIQGLSHTAKRSARQQEAEDKCMERWGCDLATRREINREKAGLAYTRQRENAKRRCIDWNLSLGQWWDIWKRSGHWKNRGIYKGQYCMSRVGDQGPYAVGNVAIVPNSDNFKEAKSHSTKAKFTGVYCTRPGSAKPWAAYAKKRFIGYYESEELARDARARRLTGAALVSGQLVSAGIRQAHP